MLKNPLECQVFVKKSFPTVDDFEGYVEGRFHGRISTTSHAENARKSCAIFKY